MGDRLVGCASVVKRPYLALSLTLELMSYAMTEASLISGKKSVFLRLPLNICFVIYRIRDDLQTQI